MLEQLLKGGLLSARLYSQEHSELRRRGAGHGVADSWGRSGGNARHPSAHQRRAPRSAS